MKLKRGKTLMSKQKIIMTKGLPASGKSTWAKSYISEWPEFKRINKDDLRAMMHDSKHSKAREAFIIDARNTLINLALDQGFSVIVDDTNFNPIHETYLRDLCSQRSIDFEIKDFTYVDLDTCLERNRKRENSVPEKVIYDMYYKYIYCEKNAVKRNEGFPPAIMVDIDGTIAIRNDRSPYDMTKVDTDLPRYEVIEIVQALSKDNIIIFISGRTDDGEELTRKWINDHIFTDPLYQAYDLYMRKKGDDRRDSIVKKELYDNFIKNDYDVKFVLDDRRQVVDMWRNECNLLCLEIADHRF
jgi:predicted kinase